jgi:adenosylcobinamide-phosphate synthase
MPREIIIPVVALAIAVIVDQLLGEYPNAMHPVVWIGKLVLQTLKVAPTKGWWPRFLFGVALTIGLVALCVRATMLLVAWGSAYPVIEILISAYLLKASFAFRELGAAAGRVQAALEKGDLAAAQQALASLCSRDPTLLDDEALAAGAIESVAENASDSLVAPLFYFVLFGVPGAVAYRAINTLDAMIGYRGEYEALGKFAARLDDVVNWTPARLTTGLLLLSGMLLRLDMRGGWRVLRRDGAKTPSPNGGRPMGAMAGLLGVALEKPGVYVLGDAGEAVTPAKIAQARRLLTLAGWSAIGATMLSLIGVRTFWPGVAAEAPEAFLFLVSCLHFGPSLHL